MNNETSHLLPRYLFSGLGLKAAPFQAPYETLPCLLVYEVIS